MELAKGLIKRWRSAAAEICNEIVITDRISTKIVKERNFIVHDPSDGRLKDKEAIGILSYTDGSVLNSRTGCGVHTVQGKRVIYNGNFYLGNTATMFQAEVTAISAYWVLDMTNRTSPSIQTVKLA